MALVAAAWTAISGTFAGGLGAFLTKTVLGRILVTVALSALSRALQPKPTSRQRGIRTNQTMTGGITPAGFILGRYATEGQLVCPPMSHGSAAGFPNAYLTYVIELGDIPGQTLEGLIVDGTPAPIGETAHADYGLPLLDRYSGRAWIRFHDGTQTSADAMLLAKYGSAPDRPWGADMVGAGICYAIVTFRYDREVFSNFPKVRFVLGGIPLYDPRKDGSVGGSGPQRWGDPATWEVSENPAVQTYNTLRGITLPGGHSWGGDAAADDLPLANWWAAMNAADVAVELAAGGTEPQYRAGFEVAVDDEPADVIDELMKACSGQLSEVGGIWKIRIGGPGLPVWFFTDEDVVVTASQELDPYPGIAETYNAVHASYPAPESLWESRDAPPRYNATYEAADGGRRLPADLNLPAAPYPVQVQRLMRAYIEEERRMRRHTLTLPPEAMALEPLDAVSWSSARNGYAGKIFEVTAHVDPLVTGTPQLSLRERAPADYDWNKTDELPSPPAPTGYTPPPAQSVSGWSVSAISIEDSAGTPRRPALLLAWTAEEQSDVRAVQWEVRVISAPDLLRGSITDVAAGQAVIAEGILPATDYEVRARFVADRPTEWTAWTAVTTLDIRIVESDLATVVSTKINDAKNTADQVRQDHDTLMGAFTGTLDDLLVDYNTATTAAEVASESSTQALTRNIIVDSELQDGSKWLSHYGHDGALYFNQPFGDSSGNGYRHAGTGQAWWYQTYIHTVEPDRVFELTMEYRASADSAGIYFTLGVPGSANYGDLAPSVIKDGTWRTVTIQTTGAAILSNRTVSGNKIQFGFAVNQSTGAAGSYGEVRHFRVEDITESHTAGSSASAAAGSASTASTKATEASQSASAANSSKVAAETAKGQAEAAKTAAATSETNALGSKNAAANSASAAATSATNAGNSASAAAGSASIASTKAGAADGSASAAASSAQTASAAVNQVKALIGNFDFRNEDENWNMTGTRAKVTGNDYAAGVAYQFDGAGSAVYGTKIPVSRDRIYRLRARVKNISAAGTCRFYAGVHTYDGAGVLETASPGAARYCAASAVDIPNDGEWHEYSGKITGGGSVNHNQFRPTTAFAAPILLVNYTQGVERKTIVDYCIFEDITEAKAEAGIAMSAIADTEGKLSSMIALRAKAGTAGAELELIAADNPTGTASIARISATDIVLDGTVTTELLQAKAVNVSRMTIDEYLDMDAVNTGFRMGKTTAQDFTSDGIYMGRSMDQLGGVGFGFMAGRTEGDKEEYLQITKDTGLVLKNARFLIGAGAPTQGASNTGTTITMPAATNRLTFIMTGAGGGGGEAVLFTSGASGAAGGDTVAKLYDGAVLKETWTATGGRGGGASDNVTAYSRVSALSPRGVGGAGGFIKVSDDNARGSVGEGGTSFEILDYDVSALADPKLVITIGTGGTGGGTGAGAGVAGIGGRIEYTYAESVYTPACVISPEPTASGTILVTSGVAGNFPGAPGDKGFWIVQKVPNGFSVDVGNGDRLAQAPYQYSMSFFAGARPSWNTSHNQTVTMDYLFYQAG